MVANLRLLSDSRIPEEHLEYLRTSVGDLLTRASNLNGLTLGDSDGSLNIPRIIGGVRPSFHLVELVFHFRITRELWDFIFSQPTIQRLVLNCCLAHSSVTYRRSNIPSHIPTDALPRLEALSAPVELLMILLPGRPVRYVAVQPSIFSPFTSISLWEAVQESSAALIALSIDVGSAPPSGHYFENFPIEHLIYAS